MLSPTRELALQIAEQFEALGAGIGVRCAVLVGGIDMMAQAIALGKRPHIIVGTPGRVVDHLSNTKVMQTLQGFTSSATIHTHRCTFSCRHIAAYLSAPFDLNFPAFVALFHLMLELGSHMPISNHRASR